MSALVQQRSTSQLQMKKYALRSACAVPSLTAFHAAATDPADRHAESGGHLRLPVLLPLHSLYPVDPVWPRLAASSEGSVSSTLAPISLAPMPHPQFPMRLRSPQRASCSAPFL